MGLVLTGGFRAVVTTDTEAEDVHVIEVRRHPASGCMAVIAGIATGDMREVLAGGMDAVVAPNAIANNAAMVEHSS